MFALVLPERLAQTKLQSMRVIKSKIKANQKLHLTVGRFSLALATPIGCLTLTVDWFIMLLAFVCLIIGRM